MSNIPRPNYQTLENLIDKEFPKEKNEISFLLNLTGKILWKHRWEKFKPNCKNYDSNTKENTKFLEYLYDIIKLFPTTKNDAINIVYVLCLKKLS